MRVFAYCTLTAREAVEKATGVRPLTSPPMLAQHFDPQRMEGYDLLYFRLHGFEDIPDTWFGEDGRGPHLPLALRAAAIKRYPAMTASQLDDVDLGGAVVVIANCYGADSPLVAGFYQAGAAAVIAGSGPNLAAAQQVVGTDALVQALIAAMNWGFGVRRALILARARLLATIWRAADRDALELKIMEVET